MSTCSLGRTFTFIKLLRKNKQEKKNKMALIETLSESSAFKWYTVRKYRIFHEIASLLWKKKSGDFFFSTKIYKSGEVGTYLTSKIKYLKYNFSIFQLRRYYWSQFIFHDINKEKVEKFPTECRPEMLFVSTLFDIFVSHKMGLIFLHLRDIRRKQTVKLLRGNLMLMIFRRRKRLSINNNR